MTTIRMIIPSNEILSLSNHPSQFTCCFHCITHDIRYMFLFLHNQINIINNVTSILNYSLRYYFFLARSIIAPVLLPTLAIFFFDQKP